MYFNVNLVFNGNCAEAFEFYYEVLGGDLIEETILYKDVADDVEEMDRNKVFYTELMLGDFVLRGQDDIGDFRSLSESNTILNLDFDSQFVGEEIYQLLSEDGIIIEPLDQVFDDLIYGKFIDKFGIMWEILIHQ